MSNFYLSLQLTQGEELNEKSEKHSTNETTTLNTENFEKILKTSVETKFVENDETVSLSGMHLQFSIFLFKLI